MTKARGWFGKPMPFANGKWYPFSRHLIHPKPAYCPGEGWQIVVRESSDRGRVWSNRATVVVAPGPQAAPDACAIVDGSSYFDRATDTWHMLAQWPRAMRKAGRCATTSAAAGRRWESSRG
jgi:hypothetical protein